MTTLAVWLFAGSAGLVLYAYVGYPLLLFALGKVRSAAGPPTVSSQDPVQWPMVSVTVPVYNEERTIREKLEEVLRYDYPPERLQHLEALGRVVVAQYLFQFFPDGALFVVDRHGDAHHRPLDGILRGHGGWPRGRSHLPQREQEQRIADIRVQYQARAAREEPDGQRRHDRCLSFRTVR